MSYAAPTDRVVWSSETRRGPGLPTDWINFYQLANSNGSRSEGNLFLHERVSPAGNRRLVAIEFYCGGHIVFARVFVPGTLLSRPHERTSSMATQLSLPDHCTVVYAGQPDRSDAAHFTIRYEAAGKTHSIDGWLTDEDQVLLEQRRNDAVACVTP